MYMCYLHLIYVFCLFCCFNDTATTESYTYLHTLSLHDALPISMRLRIEVPVNLVVIRCPNRSRGVSELSKRNGRGLAPPPEVLPRSEEHTSELQSLMRISYAVFCLKKKTQKCTDTSAQTETTTEETQRLIHTHETILSTK